MPISRYNVRVYGLCFNRAGQVLLTDERRGGFKMTKFPGGGHEFGEGLVECLQREFMEELSMEVKANKLFYINDFLQVSAFNPSDQILAAYYLVEACTPKDFPLALAPFSFPSGTGDAQTFRWKNPLEMRETELTFPIDRVVLQMLCAQLSDPESLAIQRLIRDSVY